MRLGALPRTLCLRPTYRAAHGFTDHGIKPDTKFCDSPGKTLAGQFGQRVVEWGGLEREVASLDAIGPTGCDRLARLHTQRFLTRAQPPGKVCQSWWPL